MPHSRVAAASVRELAGGPERLGGSGPSLPLQGVASGNA